MNVRTRLSLRDQGHDGDLRGRCVLTRCADRGTGVRGRLDEVDGDATDRCVEAGARNGYGYAGGDGRWRAATSVPASASTATGTLGRSAAGRGAWRRWPRVRRTVAPPRPGVTADSVKVVAIIPVAERSAAQTKAAPPINRAGNTPSTWRTRSTTTCSCTSNFYEQWGRAIDVEFYTSTGVDETAQRADLVAITAMKPFAVINFDTYGLDVLVTGLAQKKILVQSYSTSPAESAAVAPYRWGGGSDQDAAATNAAEVIGKNLVGKNAEFGGDDVKSQARKFGLVQVKDLIDIDAFKKNLAAYKGTKIASEFAYQGTGGAAGDASISQQEAPTIVQRMKAAGVTTVDPVRGPRHERGPDGAGDAAGMASRVVLHRLGLRRSARARPGNTRRAGRARLRHLADRPVLRVPTRSQAVLRGRRVRTTGTGAPASAPPRGSCRRAHLDPGRDALRRPGPQREELQQGLFAAPPTGGDPKNPLATLSGYGRTTGLPYDAYTPGPADFAAFFMDPHTTAISPGTGTSAQHASFYPDDAAPVPQRPVAEGNQMVRQDRRHDPAAGVPANRAAAEGIPAVRDGSVSVDGCGIATQGANGDTFMVEPTPAAIVTT